MKNLSKPKYANERFGNAVQLIPQATPPIWFMRQAGRYHKHYRNLKEKNSFMELCKNPELAAEVALGPVLEFDFDVSILFSDLLFPLEAMGMGLEYSPGPILNRQIRTLAAVRSLKSVPESVAALEFQKQAVKYTRELLPKNVSLIGFVGGPWTLYSYAAKGGHEINQTEIKCEKSVADAFYEKILPLLVENIRLQLEGGAEMVMILDTAAGELSPDYFENYVKKPLIQICDSYPDRIGYYAKGGTESQFRSLSTLTGLGGLGIDHRFSIAEFLEARISPGFVQGNFDQSLLFLPRDEFRKAFREYLKPILNLNPSQRAGWVAGLGHGLMKDTPEENVKEAVLIIREAFQ
jgi:uroporphyrinogen decarboxylase